MNLQGEKVVLIFSSEIRVFTVRESCVTERNEIDAEVFRTKPGNITTWFHGFNRAYRLATEEEVKNDARFEGSCPHKFITYDQLAIKSNIPLKRQKYSDADSWMVYCCEWCGLKQKNGEILEKPYRW